MKAISDLRSRWRLFPHWAWLFLSGFIGLGFAGGVRAEDNAAKGKTFKLREVPVFTLPQGSDLLRGQTAVDRDQPFPVVKVYPALVSTKPVYGSIRLGAGHADTNSGREFYFALDESGGTGKGYDRLYFDFNQDLNLTNDPVLRPQSNPPDKARLTYGNIKQQVTFDFLAVPLDFGPAGLRPVQIMPRLTISAYDGKEYPGVTFVRTRFYEGDIQLGSADGHAALGNDYAISGRLDGPGTRLEVDLRKPDWGNDWWGGDRLTAAHEVEGAFYTFTASPTGDELTVWPYQGDLGTFEVGPGNRKLDDLTVRGSLEAEKMNVAVGGKRVNGMSEPARRCRIPAGNYLPNYLTIRFGRLSIALSQNYHSDGKPRDRGGRPPVYGMAVRKDQPFVLDFSNPPDVMFASPAANHRVKAGDELLVKAVLVDPKLDFMIRGLDDTTRKQTKNAEGKSLGYERNLSLDPKVIITRMDGEKVAEGVMPFG
jgi:hypothetical protein